MPVIRRDEASDPIGPTLLYLWGRKGIILGAGFAVALLTFVVLQFVREEYKAFAQVYVNRFSVEERERERELVEVPNPITVANLMESPAIIAAVREDFRRAFNIRQLPKLERFARAFSANTDVLQDTTVRKDVMPVIELTVQSKGTSETRFLMESWLKHIMDNLGDYATREAMQKREALLQEIETVQAEIQDFEEAESRLRTELLVQQKLLAETVDTLAPAEPLMQIGRGPERLPLAQEEGDDLMVTVHTSSQERAGLLRQVSELQLQLSRARLGSSTSPTAEIQREITALENVIRDTQTSISQFQIQVAQLEQNLSTASREVTLKTRMLVALNDSLARFAALSAVQRHRANELVGSDLQVLSRPVLPEEKVWPRRTLSAGLTGFAAMMIMALGLLIYRYLRLLSQGSPGRDIV